MIERKCGPFIAVPYDAVTVNGHYLQKLNSREEPYPGYWALVAPNKRAVDGEDGSRPHLYLSIEEAQDDSERLSRFGECSTCGGVVALTDKAIESEVSDE